MLKRLRVDKFATGAAGSQMFGLGVVGRRERHQVAVIDIARSVSAAARSQGSDLEEADMWKHCLVAAFDFARQESAAAAAAGG